MHACHLSVFCLSVRGWRKGEENHQLTAGIAVKRENIPAGRLVVNNV